MEEPSVTLRPHPDPDVRALEAQHLRDLEELELAAAVIAADQLLISMLVRALFATRAL